MYEGQRYRLNSVMKAEEFLKKNGKTLVKRDKRNKKRQEEEAMGEERQSRSSDSEKETEEEEKEEDREEGEEGEEIKQKLVVGVKTRRQWLHKKF